LNLATNFCLAVGAAWRRALSLAGAASIARARQQRSASLAHSAGIVHRRKIAALHGKRGARRDAAASDMTCALAVWRVAHKRAGRAGHTAAFAYATHIFAVAP